MVRVDNIFGDITTGKSGEAVYQRKYGRGMRRMYKETRKDQSPQQLENQQHFKDTIAWIKSLTYQEKEAVRSYCRTNRIGDRQGEPIHWYNFLKSFGLSKPRLRILSKETGRYILEHPAIMSVEEQDILGNTIFYIDDLSDVLDNRYQDTFDQVPQNGTYLIKTTILPGIQYDFVFPVKLSIAITFPCPS